MKTKETVKELLIKTPHLRDSDNKLIATYWWRELKYKKLNVDDMSAMDILEMYSKSQLTNTETIRRMRAKLQEENPELRGKVYHFRKQQRQKKWRKDLGYENNQ